MKNYKNITPDELDNIMSEKDVFVLDVRAKNEYDDCHIEGAELIPLDELSKELLDPHDLKSKKTVVYCKGGGRSARACEKLSTIYTDCEFYNLEGGIMAWMSQGLPVIRGKGR